MIWRTVQGITRFMFCAGTQHHRRGGGVQGNRFTVQGITCYLFCAGAQHHRRGGGVQGNRFSVQGFTCFTCSAQAHNITDVVVACRETGLQYRVPITCFMFCAGAQHHRRGGGVQGNRFGVVRTAAADPLQAQRGQG